MIIDSHQHFWDPARGDYEWLTPGMSLYRPYGPDDLKPLLSAEGVDATILVQAAPTEAETDYLLDIAERTPWVAGVIGWVDLVSPNAERSIAKRASQQRFVGLRPMLQDMTNPNWILDADTAAALKALAAHGLVFDALIRTEQVPVIEKLGREYPDLAIVLDHAGKPRFGHAGAMENWAANIKALAKRKNVACKLSGLLTELPDPADRATLERCIAFIVEQFGWDRLLWGSDWPVLTLVTGYGHWMRHCTQFLASLPGCRLPAIFGQNACRIYRLQNRVRHKDGQ